MTALKGRNTIAQAAAEQGLGTVPTKAKPWKGETAKATPIQSSTFHVANPMLSSSQTPWI